jgi:flagellar biosynthetic protein FlhB
MAEEEDDDSQKTEDPTSKRLSEAKEKGNIPISRDIATWTLLLGMVISVAILIPLAMPSILTPMQAIFAKAGEISLEESNFGAVLGEVFSSMIFPVLSILLVLALLAITGHISQTGPIFNMSLISMKWERLNPVEGFKRLFNANALFELLKSVLKIILIGWIAYSFLKPAFMDMEAMTGLDNLALVHVTYDLTVRMFFGILLTFTVVAVIDLIYQRFTHFKKLKMSRTELKEEFRQSEGDPHVKNRLKQIRNEKARKRMMAAVPKADVIITNPTHYAIALKYEAGLTAAPVVLAKGQDFIALKIRELATEHNVPIVSNPPLARALYATVEIDEEIPAQHYRAVAEVISYVFRLRKAKR